MELLGLILVNRTGGIISTNPAADRLIPQGQRVRLAEFASHGLAACGEGRIVSWPREEGKAPWLIWVTPMINGHLEPSTFALAFYDVESVPEVCPQLLATLYSLTKAEVRLAIQVLAGKSPAEAAIEMGVTIHTVRTYLKRLYFKAGVKSQAGLVRKLLQCANHTAPHA